MARWFKTGVVLAVGLGLVPVLGQNRARAQVFERERTITGPRGRSIDRDVQIRRGPAGVERDITIHRPAGTFQQSTFVARPRGFVGGGGGGWGPGPRVIERDVFINRGGGGGMGPWGAGLLGGALGVGAGLIAGSALASPPPQPVYVTPAPVVVAQPAPPPVVEYVPPVRYQQAPQQTVVVDPVAQEIARFQSNHDASRRDAALHLGRMGDARAVMPLVDRLKNDRSRDVRIAAATALGDIGAPDASIYLERSIVYDKKQEVRDASTAALARLRQAQASVSPTAGFSSSPTQTSQVPALSPLGDDVPPPPRPANGPR